MKTLECIGSILQDYRCLHSRIYTSEEKVVRQNSKLILKIMNCLLLMNTPSQSINCASPLKNGMMFDATRLVQRADQTPAVATGN